MSYVANITLLDEKLLLDYSDNSPGFCSFDNFKQ